MSDTIRLLALVAGFAAVGAAVVVLAGFPRGRIWLPTVVGLAPAAGIAACGVAASLCAMVGVDVHPLTAGMLVGNVLLLVWLVMRPVRIRVGELSPPTQGRGSGAVELVLLAALAVLSVAVIRLNAATGLYAWDGWAMWGPKAHALYVEGDVWGPVFRDPAYVMQHQEYPVLYPALEALSAGAVGRFDPALIDVLPGAVLVAFGWGVWAALRLVVAPPLAAAAALALTGSRPLIENGAGNYADSVVASFTALGLLCLFLWLVRGPGATLVLSGLFLAAAASTKAEGLLFALAAIVAAVATARGFGRSVRVALVFASAVLSAPIVWAVVNRLNGPSASGVDSASFFDPQTMLDDAARIPTAASWLVREIADSWPQASLTILLALVAACLVRLWWHAAFVALFSLLAFAGLVATYYSSVDPLGWLLVTSADRVVFSVVLATATAAPLLAWLAWERTRSRSPGTSARYLDT